jgi:hypothetical protein
MDKQDVRFSCSHSEKIETKNTVVKKLNHYVYTWSILRAFDACDQAHAMKHVTLAVLAFIFSEKSARFLTRMLQSTQNDSGGTSCSFLCDFACKGNGI